MAVEDFERPVEKKGMSGLTSFTMLHVSRISGSASVGIGLSFCGPSQPRGACGRHDVVHDALWIRTDVLW